MINGDRPARQRGFTYLIMLFTLAMMGIVLAMQASLYSFDRQRQKEEDLLRAGRDLQRALQSYYNYRPPGSPAAYPPSLEDLLEDSRATPLVLRHLRRIPLDPMTGTYEWGLKQLDGGQIIGVFSSSEKPPIKKANFRASEKDFEKASSYQGWEFVGSALAPPAAAGGAPTEGGVGGGGTSTSPGNGPGNPPPGQGVPHNR